MLCLSKMNGLSIPTSVFSHMIQNSVDVLPTLETKDEKIKCGKEIHVYLQV